MCSFQRYICWQRTSGVWRRMGQASSGKLTFHGNFSQVTILLSTQTLSIRTWGNLYRFWHLSLDYIIKHATWLSEENRYGKHSWGFNWLLCPQDSPGTNTGVSCHALLQGIFLTQRLNWTHVSHISCIGKHVLYH